MGNDLNWRIWIWICVSNINLHKFSSVTGISSLLATFWPGKSKVSVRNSFSIIFGKINVVQKWKKKEFLQNYSSITFDRDFQKSIKASFRLILRYLIFVKFVLVIRNFYFISFSLFTCFFSEYVMRIQVVVHEECFFVRRCSSK